jgi:RNA methyltransferase, TrmH family
MRAIGKDHDIIKMIRKRKNKNVHDGLALVEEIGVLEKYLSSKYIDKFPINTLLFCPELITSEYAQKILVGLMNIAENTFSVSEKTYELFNDKKNSAGVFAVIEWKDLSYEDFLKEGYKNVVIIDALENPGNVGTIFRTADATGIDAIIAVDLKTMVYSKKCISASRGMLFEIPVLSLNFRQAQSLLIENGYTIYLGEPKEGKSYSEIEYADKKAVVVGSERFGINAEWYNNKHEKIFIPMKGSMTSLNVGVAASIIMYEMMK